MRGWGLIFGVIAGCGASSHAADDAGREDAFGARDGGASDAGFDAGPPPTPEESFRAEYARIRCEHAVRCARPLPSDGMWESPELACHPEYPAWWLARVPRLLAEGQIRFDATVAEECLDWIRMTAVSCTYSLGTMWSPSPCPRVYVGLVPDGEPCWRLSPSVCAPESFCDADFFGERGTCAPRPLLGEPCGGLSDCAGFPETATCVEGVCRAPGAEGDACEFSLDCTDELSCHAGSCTAPYVGMSCAMSSCGDTLTCFEGTCTPPTASGDACGPTRPRCAFETTCAGDPPACVPACYAFYDYAFDTCEGDEICRLEARSGLYAEGTCVVGQPIGAICDEPRPCTKGGRCVGGLCKLVVLPEQPCGGDLVCPVGFACVERACEPLAAPGQRCDPAVGCLRGECIGGVCCLAAEGAICEEDHPSPLGMCAGRCWPPASEGLPAECYGAPACDESCAGRTCWGPDPDRCVPLCP